jgi:27-O-demethylrifamycin SV methyltransferase
MTADFEPAAHYDRVTDAWGLLLGNELHYGVFEQGDEPLAEATRALTRRMVDGLRAEPGQRILDVGCGTGAPACDLAESLGVEVLGITTSEVGVEAARARAEQRGLSDRVAFELRDGTDNGLPEASFDRVWALESSHLMPDRRGLISECARVLRPGGRFVLCDVMRLRTIPFDELRRRKDEFAVLRAAFGNARMDTMDEYVSLAEEAGLTVDTREDLSAATLPTFRHWIANAEHHYDDVVETLGEEGVNDFTEGSRVLDTLWREGTLGYGLFAAARPSA